MNWILDIAVLAILVIYIVLGMRRGAIRTVVEFVGFFAALVVAAMFSDQIGTAVFQNFIRPGMLESMENALESAIAGSVDPVTALSEQLPGYVSQFFDGATLTSKMESAVQSGSVEGALILTDSVIGPVVIMLIRVIAAIVLFLLVMLAIRLIAGAADLIAKLPVLNQLNKGLGAVCGAAKGLVIIFLVTAVICGAAPFLAEHGVIRMEYIEQSVVFGRICEINPLYQMFAPK